MNFELSETLAKQLLAQVPPDCHLASQLAEHRMANGKLVVNSRHFDGESLNTLYALSKTLEDRTLMLQLLALDNIRSAPDARQIPSLDVLINGMVAYLQRDVIDGWLYKRNRDGVLLPWLVTGMRHMVPVEATPYVVISLLANTLQSANKEVSDDYRQRRSGMSTVIVIDANDIADRT